MQQKRALIRGNSCFLFQPIFQQCQRARPHKFRKNSPNQRGNMQTHENRMRAGEKSPEDDPYDEENMDEQHERCEYGIHGGRPNGPM